MTFRSLKIFIKNNSQPNNVKIFDLIIENIKSKIIFIVRNGAENTSTYLSSIMSACEISHFHYINKKDIDINKRFWQNTEQISIDLICQNAEKILKYIKKNVVK